MIEQIVYAFVVLFALALGVVSFSLNAFASKKFLDGPFKTYITLKFYGEFFMAIFLISYFFRFILNIFEIENVFLVESLNIVSIVLIIVGFMYFLMGGLSLKRLSKTFGFAK